MANRKPKCKLCGVAVTPRDLLIVDVSGASRRIAVCREEQDKVAWLLTHYGAATVYKPLEPLKL